MWNTPDNSNLNTTKVSFLLMAKPEGRPLRVVWGLQATCSAVQRVWFWASRSQVSFCCLAYAPRAGWRKRSGGALGDGVRRDMTPPPLRDLARETTLIHSSLSTGQQSPGYRKAEKCGLKPKYQQIYGCERKSEWLLKGWQWAFDVYFC